MTSHTVTSFFQTYRFLPTSSRLTIPRSCIAERVRRTLLSFLFIRRLSCLVVKGSFGMARRNSFMSRSVTVILKASWLGPSIPTGYTAHDNPLGSTQPA